MTYPVVGLGAWALNHPSFDLEFAGWERDDSLTKFGRRHGGDHEILMRETVTAARDNPQFNLQLLTNHLLASIAWVADPLDANGYFDKAPVLEFFRHVRNGVSHGNRFYFKPPEPRRHAAFRSFQLDASLHGRQILLDYLNPGDVLDLFEDAEAHLRQLPTG